MPNVHGSWPPDCAPRVIVAGCSSPVILETRLFKGVTAVFQLLTLISFVLKLRQELALASRLSCSAVVIYSVLGVFHSVFLMIATDDVPVVLVEFVFSGYNCFLFATLGLLCPLWVELYQSHQQSHCYLWAAAGLSAVTAAVSIGTDIYIAVAESMDSFNKAVDIQHACYVSLCAAFSIYFWISTAQLLKSDHDKSDQQTDGRPQVSVKALRVLCSQLMASLDWIRVYLCYL